MRGIAWTLNVRLSKLYLQYVVVKRTRAYVADQDEETDLSPSGLLATAVFGLRSPVASTASPSCRLTDGQVN